jgi:catechol 2,3-dioxygenase-like lactoylglutathione lyase family enzyme
VPTTLHHANIQVSDAAASIAFYGRLGLDPVGRMGVDAVTLYYLGGPGGDFVLELADNPGLPERIPGSGHLALVVDDLDEVLERLAEGGILPEGPPYHPGGRDSLRICFVRDPDGIRVELIDREFPIPTE